MEARPATAAGSTRRSAAVRTDLSPPKPPHLDRVVEELELDQVWDQINPQMLYGKHLGLKGSVKQLEAKHDPKLAKLEAVVAEVQQVAKTGVMHARAVWQFLPARSEGNRLTVLEPRSGKTAASWEMPRQTGPNGLCISDYVLSENDHLALFVTSAGAGVGEQASTWKSEGEYLKSHALLALALETAEAAAELLHMRLRELWGFPDPSEMTRQDRFAARYRGKRYSFGYPACPDLALQEPLFYLLQPEEIGVTLTEEHMMEPEAAVSALVFHHPGARFFNVFATRANVWG